MEDDEGQRQEERHPALVLVTTTTTMKKWKWASISPPDTVHEQAGMLTSPRVPNDAWVVRPESVGRARSMAAMAPSSRSGGALEAAYRAVEAEAEDVQPSKG